MATIEERAKKLIFEIIEDCIDFGAREVLAGRAVEYATNTLKKQDRIARQEERDRCIKAACREHCLLCRKRYGDFGCTNKNKYCTEPDKIRKAMRKESKYE